MTYKQGVCYNQDKTGETATVPGYDKIPTYLNPEQRHALTQIPPDLSDRDLALQEVSGNQKVLHTRPTRRGLVQATLRYRGEGDQCQSALLGVSLFARAGWYRSAEPIECVTHQRSLQLLAACRTRVR